MVSDWNAGMWELPWRGPVRLFFLFDSKTETQFKIKFHLLLLIHNLLKFFSKVNVSARLVLLLSYFFFYFFCITSLILIHLVRDDRKSAEFETAFQKNQIVMSLNQSFHYFGTQEWGCVSASNPGSNQILLLYVGAPFADFKSA